MTSKNNDGISNSKNTKNIEDEKDLKIKELNKQVDQLKMEIDLLKKLNAVVQQRDQQPEKKK